MGQTKPENHTPKGGYGLPPSPLEDPLARAALSNNRPILFEPIAHPLVLLGSSSRQAGLIGAQTHAHAACPVIREGTTSHPLPAPW